MPTLSASESSVFWHMRSRNHATTTRRTRATSAKNMCQYLLDSSWHCPSSSDHPFMHWTQTSSCSLQVSQPITPQRRQMKFSLSTTWDSGSASPHSSALTHCQLQPVLLAKKAQSSGQRPRPGANSSLWHSSSVTLLPKPSMSSGLPQMLPRLPPRLLVQAGRATSARPNKCTPVIDSNHDSLPEVVSAVAATCTLLKLLLLLFSRVPFSLKLSDCTLFTL
mmetsp:Transcript_40709/g.93589  ORF Transcript_40709/g.93589 Transcript_40709/m.93589 type:complete len:221 (-) Transcript_40709:300-962(-)